MLRSVLSVFALGCAFAAPAFAQSRHDVEPSLPVPTPPEERAEMTTPEFYAVANNGELPRAFDARRTAAKIAARQSHKEVASQLRTLPPESRGYYVKAGAFQSFENAQRLHAKLFAIGSAQITHREAHGQDFYGVYLGPWKTQAEAEAAYELALKAGMQDGAVIAPR